MAKIRVTLVKSISGYPEDQRQTVRRLGFRRLNQSVIHEDSAAVRGMMMKVKHLIKAEEVTGEAK